jgi:hypothetical protein
LTPADVVLDEYPKSGGTWVAFMLGEVLFGRPVDFENQEVLVPAVGRHAGLAPSLPGSGRFLRSHEPYRSEYRKAIYLVRNIADVAVSYFNNLRWLRIEVSFKEFLPALLTGRVDGYGTWASHVESWLDASVGSGEILVVRYEELRTSPEELLLSMADFLGVEADQDRIRSAVANNSLERMREKQERARDSVFTDRDPASDFVRKGAVGDSASWMDPEDEHLIARYAGATLERLGYSVNG